MSVTQVYKAIERHLRPLQLRRFLGEAIVRGQEVRTFGEPETIQLATFPITDKDLRFLPEGVYTIQDRSFYEIGSGTIPQKSEITFENEKFELKSIAGRSFEGNFSKYIGKKITDDTTNYPG